MVDGILQSNLDGKWELINTGGAPSVRANHSVERWNLFSDLTCKGIKELIEFIPVIMFIKSVQIKYFIC